MNLKTSLSALIVATLTAAGAASAATATDSIAVTATVVAACAIDTANDLGFGDYNPVSGTAFDATASIGVRCTNGHPYSIGLDLGANADGSTRRMVHATDAAQFLTYELYSDAGRTAVWGDADPEWVSETGSGSEQTKTIHGRIAASQGSAEIGSYSDLVTVTVTY